MSRNRNLTYLFAIAGGVLVYVGLTVSAYSILTFSIGVLCLLLMFGTL